jgi:hypothetical protein
MNMARSPIFALLCFATLAAAPHMAAAHPMGDRYSHDQSNDRQDNDRHDNDRRDRDRYSNDRHDNGYHRGWRHSTATANGYGAITIVSASAPGAGGAEHARGYLAGAAQPVLAPFICLPVSP